VSPAFRLGVNYWPARTAMAWWPRFDPAEVADDFARIAGSGMDCVRLFLRWEDFQPEPDAVDPVMLRRLVTVADSALDAGLSVMPTLFTGHMSGVNWIPPWALGGSDRDPRFRVVAGGRVVDGGLRNWYADLGILDAHTMLATEAAAALAGHEALWAWDLGNENSNCVVPPTRALGAAWLERMATAIRGADDAARVTIGLHMEDLEEDRRMGPRDAAAACDFLTMHGYPIYAGWARGATDDLLVPFLARVTRWLGGGMDVLFSEFGLPTQRPGRPADPMLVDEEVAAHYTERVLAGLRDAGCLGAMVWCYADYAPNRFGTPPLDEAPHERSFGLWRADGSPKPSVPAIADLVGEPRRSPPADDWIDIDPGTYWRDPAAELPRLYARFRAGVGGPPDYPLDDTDP